MNDEIVKRIKSIDISRPNAVKKMSEVMHILYEIEEIEKSKACEIDKQSLYQPLEQKILKILDDWDNEINFPAK